MIRQATTDDLGALLALLRRFHASTAYGRWLAFSATASERTLRALIEDDDASIFGTEDVCGALGMMALPSMFTDDVTANEVFWWVDVERRGAGLALYRAAMRWAEAKGATMAALIAPAGSTDVHRLYERLGYAPVERAFVRIF